MKRTRLNLFFACVTASVGVGMWPVAFSFADPKASGIIIAGMTLTYALAGLWLLTVLCIVACGIIIRRARAWGTRVPEHPPLPKATVVIR